MLALKRLRDNWTRHKANDRRNSLAADRLNYDVLNHTDLSRDAGLSGDADLEHVNWGNYEPGQDPRAKRHRDRQHPQPVMAMHEDTMTRVGQLSPAG